MSKGFITVAAGERYLELAKHLYKSYKLFAKCDYPFYIITDEYGKNHLDNLFDGVIVKEMAYSFLDKMVFFTDTPFEETIFIDADCSVVKDLSNLFDVFETNKADVCAIAGRKELVGEAGIQFGKQAVLSFDIKYDFPNFNGGVYFYKKSEVGKLCVDFIMNTLLQNREKYQLRIDLGDEPLVIVGMLKFGYKPIPVEMDIMRLVHNPLDVKWDMKNNTCSYSWYHENVSTQIIHWKFGGTETYAYQKYNVLLNSKYYNYSIFRLCYKRITIFVKYRIYAKLVKVFPFLSKIINNLKNK